MRKLIAKLHLHFLNEEVNKRDSPFLVPSGFVAHSEFAYRYSTPETSPVKEYYNQLPAVHHRSAYIHRIYSEMNIHCRIERNDISRSAESTTLFSYSEPANSIPINRNRFTNIIS